MAEITYKTRQKPAVQKAVCAAIEWIGPRQTSYSEIARIARVGQSDCRYAVLDLVEAGHLKRTQVKGYKGATRGNRYMYELTDSGKEFKDIPIKKVPAINPGIFLED